MIVDFWILFLASVPFQGMKNLFNTKEHRLGVSPYRDRPHCGHVLYGALEMMDETGAGSEYVQIPFSHSGFLIGCGLDKPAPMEQLVLCAL